MKKTALALFTVYAIVAVSVFSCQKSYNSQGPKRSLNQLFADLRTTPQSLSVTAGRDTIVWGTNGTRLHFYTNSFKGASGNIISSGTIYLQLTEMYKPGDMVANRATTAAAGQILQSAGQVSIIATQNGQTVYANAYGIAFPHSTPSSAPMALFFGGTNNADSIVTWTQGDTTHNGVVARGTNEDSAYHGSSYAPIFNFDSCTNFTGANCDWFYKNDSPETTVGVILPDTTFNPSNTQVYLILPNVNRWGNTADTFNAVMSNDGGYGSTGYSSATNTLSILSEGHTNIVPAGLFYKLVVITNKNGQYYFWQTSGTVPHNGVLVNAALAVDTHSDILARLSGL